MARFGSSPSLVREEGDARQAVPTWRLEQAREEGMGQGRVGPGNGPAGVGCAGKK